MFRHPVISDSSRASVSPYYAVDAEALHNLDAAPAVRVLFQVSAFRDRLGGCN